MIFVGELPLSLRPTLATEVFHGEYGGELQCASDGYNPRRGTWMHTLGPGALVVVTRYPPPTQGTGRP